MNLLYEKIGGDKAGRDIIKDNIIIINQNKQKKHIILEQFKIDKVMLILSNLYSPKLVDQNTKLIVPSLLKYDSEKFIPINSGFPVTGIWDCLGMSLIVSVLSKLETSIELRTDLTSQEKLKQNNLILIGGITSNNSAKFIYDSLDEKQKAIFGFSEHGDIIKIGENKFNGGDKGLLFCGKNPFNKDKKIIWLAGIGSVGTGAACHFLVNNIMEVSEDILKRDNWIIGVRGEIDGEGRLNESYKESEIGL